MKLGFHYNVFDGQELLEDSIDSVRETADFICVVYQVQSNFGHTIDVQRVLDLSDKIDHLFLYIPSKFGGHHNEVLKRNIGKRICQTHGCTHHATIDTDELYDPDQLAYAWEEVKQGNHDGSVCKMQTYWKSTRYALDPPEEYYVPLIYKMDDRRFSVRNRMKVRTDPTRALKCDNLRIFTRDEIEMHHLSYVRDDIRTKLMNSSASVNYISRIDEIVEHYETWKPGDVAYLAGKEIRYHNLREIESTFYIK